MVIFKYLVKKYSTPKNFLLILLTLSIATWSALFSIGDQKLHLKIYDVGQGDAIFIRTPAGKQILVDGGPSSRVIGELSHDLPFYDRRLDLLVLTHPHADHLVGLIEVLRRYRVEHVLFNPVSHTTDEYRTFLKLIWEGRTPVWRGYSGDVFDLGGGVSFRVVWPGGANDLETYGKSNLNNTSLVLLLTYGDFKALLTGDAEAGIQDFWDLGPVTMVKVPHQGALDGLNANLLAKIKPKLAVVSVGKNRFGHPSERVLGEYSLRGIKIKRTDRDGTVEIISDGKNWLVR